MALFHSISQPPFYPLLLKPANSGRRCRQTLTVCSTSQRRRASKNIETDETDLPLSKKSSRKRPPKGPSRRRLITISTSDGKYQGVWSSDYVFSFGDIQMADIAEDKNARVYLNLSVQKHAGFGFSVDGRIITSFNRKCSSCFSSYCKEIDASFNVWVLPSSQSNGQELPEIGGNDPSVIYVKPGSEADLDSVIQDTIRLTASAEDTCSESCEKSAPIWHYTDGKQSYDQRWSKLLEIKNAL